MPAIDPAKRRAVAGAIRAANGTRSRASIAREFDISAGSVSNIAAENGLNLGDRSAVETATRARQTDLKARRAALQSALLDDIDTIRGKFFTAYTFVGSSKEGLETLVLDEPDAASLRNYVTSAAVLLDKHIALVRHDADSGAEGARGLIGGIMAAISDLAGPPDADAGGA